MEITVTLRGDPAELLDAQKLVEALAAVAGMGTVGTQAPMSVLPQEQIEYVTAKAPRADWREVVLRFMTEEYEAGAAMKIGESEVSDEGTTNYLRAYVRSRTYAFIRPYTPMVRFYLDEEDLPTDLGLTRCERRSGRGRSSRDNVWIKLCTEEDLAEARILAELARRRALGGSSGASGGER
jgi:hypothetical protein